ncbi:DNA topoisomerase IV subunit B [Porphyromonas sp. COT-108 OH1349]|uniref:DNA topoisomerase IV subunit B n=1 Tax=Porphyromonas sp. COT-108 OH1349 TaxID=1537504 RepID=UPI00052CBD4E|nr:DNA topoisomerase IV subunit B [Porphyromonas sp. COT-108 OH1349]KGN67743.1 DNA topoisomerase IV subunit B [Porphyromonas sp. COT-108 OH1349]
MSKETLQDHNYTDDKVITLDPMEHIRRRPGMYIGKLGDGTSPDDGIYVLLKEVIDNAIDEYSMGYGNRIEITIDEDGLVVVRDFGRGVPQGSLRDIAGKMNTGAKYDDEVFKKVVGLNGVGLKAVNALSDRMELSSFRSGKGKSVVFEKGIFVSETDFFDCENEKDGTKVLFHPDPTLFKEYHYIKDYVEQMLKMYCYLHTSLTILFNGKRFSSKRGLQDLLEDTMTGEALYPIIHLSGKDIEIAMTHSSQYGEEYYSFVNGQNTIHGGTHLSAFKEHVAKTVKEYYGKNFDVGDVRSGIVAAISIRIQEPLFESQTKTKLGSRDIAEGGISLGKFVGDFLKVELDNYLHKNSETSDILYKKILESEKERKSIAGITKLAKERAKKSSIHNKKLRDCTYHYNNPKTPRPDDTSIFITEGLSASGSITQSRDAEYQAVFSLRGKPLNCYGLSKRVVYENEEFNLLQAALNIEDGIDNLRYNKVIVATDADVDGMHIRLLIITFFLQFFPDLVRQKHVYILQTPLFRVRDKGEKQTIYCYDEKERDEAVAKLGSNASITRFKGLGEITAEEFKHFIGADIRLDPVVMRKEDSIKELLDFYMGKNTPDRQEFIVSNLEVEDDVL